MMNFLERRALALYGLTLALLLLGCLAQVLIDDRQAAALSGGEPYVSSFEHEPGPVVVASR